MTQIARALERTLVRLQEVSPLIVTGKITKVAAYRLEAVGCSGAIGDLCSINSGDSALIAEIVAINGGTSILIPFFIAKGVKVGAAVKNFASGASINVGDTLMGRVIDGLGEPIDGGGPLMLKDSIDQDFPSPNPLMREPINIPFDTGVSAINAFLTMGQGQRVGLMAGSGVGKSVLLSMMTKWADADVVVVGLIGERGREVREFLEETLDPVARERSIIVAATAEQSPLIRIKAAKRCCAISEYFRRKGKRVLLLMDSLSRFAMAWREIGAVTNDLPVTKGYTPAVFAELSKLIERTGNGASDEGSITAIFTLLAEGDDKQDPIVDAARSFLDGHFVLNRELAERGHYPAIDISASISRCMDKVVSEALLTQSRRLRRLIFKYQDLADLIPLGVYEPGADPEADEAVNLYPELCQRLLLQAPNERVSLDDAHEQLAMLSRRLGH